MKIKTFKWLILTVVSMTLLFTGAYFFLLKGFLISSIGFLVMLIGGFCTALTAPKFLDNSSPTFGKKFDAKVIQ